MDNNPINNDQASTKKEQREQWEAEKIDFARQVLAQALEFMRKDNEVIGHFAQVTNSLSSFVDENPQRFWSDQIGADIEAKAAINQNGGVVLPQGVFGDLFDLIKQVILEDKKFFLELIKDIFKV